ncbi:hypothetical protein [Rhodococcus kronopolitis]|uniref:Uncharacterized protein n=1 Tax=Rhodococcus kronopolitis TaxID=1460226 RepID=A0ABV9FLL8_9NOCA
MTVRRSGRNWVRWEMTIAAALGAATAAVMMAAAPSAVPVATVLGGLIGAMVGGAAVAGGCYALASVAHWPPSSRGRWRQRFAVCSAAGVLLLVGGFVVLILMSGGASTPSRADVSVLAGVPVGFSLLAYLFALVLCPPPAAPAAARNGDAPVA